MSAPIRILVADDHPVVRDGLVAMLSTQPDFEVVAQASNGRETIEKAASYQPDVLLVDLEMPEVDGVEALQVLHERYPRMRAIAFTAYDTDERILGAVRAGAQGYLLKGAPRDELFRAIRVVSAGGALLQPVVASTLLRRLSAREDAQPPRPRLTARELEVLRLLAEGRPNREIAAALVISERTVKFHVSSILRKLHAANRTEAVAVAAQQGLVDL
ncbi:MAG: response regulator transcription factor [Chloroflexi bacterium]|nr:response regulator transcription factor [Chloroflexota bacterium]